uniref:Uncharacterized protein n=1 Tax=Alexandrium catenella TaxID=2925 RepID=A0A6T9T1T5_ALECA|mmetsp:Transcript_71227/g.189390  ORF Transcript_71227/g.189390 Transcript_71227/m.189390 type:complete len:333 (+) Transcript_71227:1-999(+)
MITVARAQLRMEKVSAGLKTATEALGIFRDLKSTRGMVKSLEVVVQAHMLQDNPNSGLQAANKELTAVKTSGNQRGEVDLLEMIAQTHAMLGQPRSAMSAAMQAKDIYTAMGEKAGEGSQLQTMAEMHRALGGMTEATACAEKALRCFKEANSRWGEEQATTTLSALLVQRGQPEKAPRRGEVQRALKDLAKAIEAHKAEDVRAAEEKLNSMNELVGEGEIQGILTPILLRDPTAVEFLEELGWKFAKEGAKPSQIRMFPHKGFYLHMIMTGMNFGPQFRVVNPYRVGTPGVDCTCITVSQLPETEAWQMEMGYRPGMLDSGLQCQAQQAFP